jgi:hypothetical protein
MVSGTAIAIYALAACLAVLVGRDVVKWLLKVDAKVIARRKAAIALSSKLSSFGLVELPKLLGEYGTGDYLGLAEEVDRQVILFLSPNGDAAVLKELEQSFDSVLAAKLADPAGLAYIQAKIAALAAPAKS